MGVLESLWTGLLAFGGAIVDGLGNVGDVLGDVVGGVGDVFGGIGDVLWDVGGTLGDWGGIIAQGWADAIVGVSGMMTGMITGLGNAYAALMSSLAGFFNVLAMFGWLIIGAIIVFIILIVILVIAFVRDKNVRRDLVTVQRQGNVGAGHVVKGYGHHRDIKLAEQETQMEALKKIPIG